MGTGDMPWYPHPPSFPLKKKCTKLSRPVPNIRAARPRKCNFQTSPFPASPLPSSFLEAKLGGGRYIKVFLHGQFLVRTLKFFPPRCHSTPCTYIHILYGGYTACHNDIQIIFVRPAKSLDSTCIYTILQGAMGATA